MRKITIKKWKARAQDGKEVDESLLVMLNVLISNKKPEELPRGLDNFRLMHRISKAFTKAEETNILELEEADYSFLKKTLETDVVGIWGTKEELKEAVEDFLNAKQE